MKLFKKRESWIGIVALIVVVVLALWWAAARLQINTDIGTFGMFAPAEDTTQMTANGATEDGVTVSRVSRTYPDVSSIVSSLSTASQFNALYKSTGVAATIKGSTKYTIFVPTNGAFAQLAPGTIGNMTAAEKKRLVQYHVISGRAVDVDALMSGTVQALSRDELNFNYSEDKIPMVNSAIVITQYTAKNGTVYLIDNVLLPPKKTQ
jgi:transforming growth factor-beta-induced protein